MTQAEALTTMKLGHHVYLTGSAGSGKTYVLNQYIQYLNDHEVVVAVTASTGIAATHMKGMTIHAWSGIGVRSFLTPYEIDQMEEKPYLWKRYEKTKVLIIDEISMLQGSFFDMLDQVCRSFKRVDIPFGGIQIILSGDLFQLPPVVKDGSTPLLVTESRVWQEMDIKVCYLFEQHRQEDDVFTDILNAIRNDTIDDSHRALLNARKYESGEVLEDVTKLFTHNVDVDALNMQALARIEDDQKIYTMTSTGKDVLVEMLKKSCLAQETLYLKRGAEVMCIKNNTERGYVNGTRGTIVRFLPDGIPVIQTRDGKYIEMYPEVWAIEDEGKVKASITQIPLRHAWAITVHKSQGMSLDAAVIDLSKSFGHGMGYVALSRVRSLAGLYLLGFHEDAFFIDPRVRALDTDLRSISEDTVSYIEALTDEEKESIQTGFILGAGGVLTQSKTSKTKTKKTVLQKEQSGTPSAHITRDLIVSGKSIEEVAESRGVTSETVLRHLEETPFDRAKAKHIQLPKKDMKHILDAFAKLSDTKLTPVKQLLDKTGYTYDYEMIRIARLFLEDSTVV